MSWCLLKQKQTRRGASNQEWVPRWLFLPEVPDSPTRTGLLLDMLLTGRKELFGNMVAEGSLSCSDHQWQSLNAEEKWERQEAEEKSGLSLRRSADFGLFGVDKKLSWCEKVPRRGHWSIRTNSSMLLNAPSMLFNGSSPMCKSQASLAEGWLSWTRKFGLNSTMKT